jgi:hypothetical protein
METQELIGHCISILEKLDVKIELKSLDDPEFSIGSGLCRIGKKRILFIDKHLPDPARLDIFIEALASLDTEGIFVPPIVRNLIDNYGEKQ